MHQVPDIIEPARRTSQKRKQQIHANVSQERHGLTPGHACAPSRDENQMRLVARPERYQCVFKLA